MSSYIIGPRSPRPTRYSALGYRQDAPGLWRLYDLECEAAVGPHYCTRAELMADLARYATENGYDAE